MSITRKIGACLILAVMAILVAAPGARAQFGQDSLDWRQRYLGILPLVKPNPSDPIVAKVNGTPITLAEVDSYARTEARMVNATTTEENKRVWHDAVDNLIGRQLLIDGAERRKIAIPDGEVAQRAREFELTTTSGSAIEASGAPDPTLMREVRDTMEIERTLDHEFETHSVKPTDAQIKQYYDEHKDLFVADPGEIRISHIAVKLPPNATDAQKKQAEAKIEKYYRQAENTKDFAALARRVSEDSQSAPKGGDLGYFRPGQLPPVVEKIAFSTKVGHLSTIISSDIGYSFIKVTERRGATYAPLKQARSKIALVLLNFNQETVIRWLLHDLKKKAKIEFPNPSGRVS
ncbi:MAG: peptidylprolyl isomerase [Candidatus Binataceae bacterium]